MGNKRKILIYKKHIMKKILFLIAFVALMFNVQAQKFVYGNLHVSKNAIVKGNITASYISNDSISINGQYITHVAGDSIPDFAWVRDYSDSYYLADLTDSIPTDAEIVSAIGTAAINGPGFNTSIKDTTGTKLIYKVIGDSTNYYYIRSVIAL